MDAMCDEMSIQPHENGYISIGSDRLGGQAAIESYSEALDLFPRDPNLWNVKGMALSKLKRYDLAIKSYDVALEHYPKETIVWINKGVALNNAGKEIEAVRCFDKVIDIDPQDADAWCQKGVSFGL